MKTFIYIFLFFCFFACNDDDHATENIVLPAATTEGLNNAGFVLSGPEYPEQNWAPYVECYGGSWSSNLCGAISSEYSEADQGIPIEFGFELSRETSDQKMDFIAGIFDLDSIGAYSDKVYAFRIWDLDKDIFYDLGINSNIEFSITRFDREANVIAGTFSGRVFNRNNQDDYIDIQDGRFDLTFNSCVCMR